MLDDMRVATNFALVGLLLVLGAFGGCGGGDSPLASPTQRIGLVDPPVLHSLMPKHIAVWGTLLGDPGDPVTLRFTAIAGTPFLGGTSATFDLPGVVANASVIRATTPYGVCSDEVVVDVTCIWPNGTESTLPGSLSLRPVTKFQPFPLPEATYFARTIDIHGTRIIADLLDPPDPVDRRGYAVMMKMGDDRLANESGVIVTSASSEDVGLVEAVGIHGELACAGAPRADTWVWARSELVPDAGKVRVKRLRDGQYWEWTTLHADDLAPDDLFGTSLDMSATLVIVGAPGNDIRLSEDAGAAYVFDLAQALDSPSGVPARNPGILPTRLLAFDGQDPTIERETERSGFGSAVSTDGVSAVVGAPGIAGGGAAYVYVRTYGPWEPQQMLAPAATTNSSAFGASVLVLGDTIFVADPVSHRRENYAGTVYVYTRSAGIWTLSQHLTPSRSHLEQGFGSCLAGSADRVVVGAKDETEGGIAGAGAVYVFEFNGSDWLEVQRLVAPEPRGYDQFGSAVGISGTNVVVGAYRDNAPETDSGAAYFY